MHFTSFTPLLWLLPVLALLLFGLYKSLVDRPRALMLTSFALRCAAVGFLLLALCRPFMARQSDHLHVAFLLDVSASVDLDSAKQSVEQIKTSIENLQSGDSWSIGIVGRDVQKIDTIQSLDQLLTDWTNEKADDEFRSASNLAEAMLVFRATFPSDKARRMILLSDGRPTGELIDDAIKQLAEENVDIRFAKVEGLRKPEAAITDLRVSTSRAFKDQIIRITATVAGNTAMPAELRISNRGVIVQRRSVKLTPYDDQRIAFDVPMTSVGDTVWTAELVPQDDHFPMNNRMATTVQVQGSPRVLVLHRKPTLMRDMSRALETQGFDVEVRPPTGLPRQMEELLSFDAVILADIPATDMQPRQMTLLKQYVSEFAGGLMMTGSENSFGLGGYYRTPVEDVLPLVSRFEKEKEKPSLAMALVIDKSGSMNGQKIMLAKQAAKAAVELLSPQDQIGVVGFDGRPFVVAEMQSAANRDSVKSQIDQLAAGGGTFMFHGMNTAKEMLENSIARIKHMIVLGDGHTQAADHETLTQQLADMGVTISTVALGSGADQTLMKRIAELGRGRYYMTMDPANVPQIFTRETMQASRSAIKEDLYTSVRVGDHAMLLGFESANLPMTLGFVMTRPKATARVLLATETGDPLLAFNRFGLGATLAYTSDMTPRWGAEWLAWSQFGKFWGQALHAIVRQKDVQGLRATVTEQGRNLQIEVHATNDNGQPANDLQLVAELTNEAGNTITPQFSQTGLGRYIARTPRPTEERTTIRIHDKTRDKLRVIHRHQPYDKEYQLAAKPAEAVAALPTLDAGSVRDELLKVDRQQRATWLFVLLAIGCLLGGILLRRV